MQSSATSRKCVNCSRSPLGADTVLPELRRLSAEIGSDIHLVQGAGGNVSVKNGRDIWVKASGTWLRDALRRDLFVRLDLDDLNANLQSGRDEFTVLDGSASGLNPSIETSFHGLLPHTVVVHVHSINTLSWAVRREGYAEVSRRLVGLPWVWVSYVRPGIPLARAIQAALSEQPNATVLVLANHGLIVCAPSIDEVRTLLREVERRLEAPRLRVPVLPDLVALRAMVPERGRLPANHDVHALAAGEVGQDALLTGALYPDHAVFLGTTIPRVRSRDDARLAAALDAFPYCGIVAHAGVVLGPECSPAAEAMLECLAILSPTLPSANQLRFLTEREVMELQNWDAEIVRQNLQSHSGEEE